MWLNALHNSLKNPDKKTIYLLIALTVIVFNLVAILGLDILLHDDPDNYTRILNGNFPWGRMKYNLFDPFLEWVLWAIMVYSPELARGLIVLCFMVPLSCCFYYIFHFKFGIPRLAAFTAATIPNILPHQWQIPGGINMSYTIWGFMFLVFSFIIGFHYLEKNTPKNWIRLSSAVILYFTSTQLMEQALFLFLPFALAFIGYSKLNKKHTWLVSSFFIVALSKFIQIMIFQRKPITFVPIDEILRRIGLYFKWSLPSPDIDPLYITIIYLSIFLIGFVLYFKNPSPFIDSKVDKNFLHMKKKTYALYFYSFLICWAVSTIFVFLFLFKGYSPRYNHISSFGLNAIFIFSIYVLVNKKFPRKYKFHHFVLVGIVVFSGVLRYIYLKEMYTPMNNNRSIITRDLNRQKFPLNSQVVIVGVNEFWGGWSRASGYLKFVLKRKDINGLIGPINSSNYYNFDDHFDPKTRGYRKRYYMSGLSMDKPVFFFIMDKEKKELKQLEYALQWRGKTKNAPWTIFHADGTTGTLSPFITGKGLDEYAAAIKKLEKKGISQSGILWGGPPTREELERLERLELDPKLFQSGFYDFQPGFRKIEPNQAEQLLSISNTLGSLANHIYFGDKFQLSVSFLDETARENGKASKFKFIHLLWKSLKKQTIKKHELAITLVKHHINIWGTWPKFCPSGLELEPGDYIFGHVNVPMEIFKKADYLGIRLSEIPGPPQWISLKIQGNHKTDQYGFRLLIPIQGNNGKER